MPKIVNGEVEGIDDKYPEFIRNLYFKISERDPNIRITIYEVYGRIESSDYKKYLSSYKLIEKLKNLSLNES